MDRKQYVHVLDASAGTTACDIGYSAASLGSYKSRRARERNIVSRKLVTMRSDQLILDVGNPSITENSEGSAEPRVVLFAGDLCFRFDPGLPVVIDRTGPNKTHAMCLLRQWDLQHRRA